ncbi:MAG TPA: TetR/AcrR family transcriptional regulator [Planctomycetota bacterium]|nr:TetR/AcrR family transcriptional regulator [Planctomycetota bacterium]
MEIEPQSDRERLIGAARALLMEDGYDAVTFDAAAGRAGIPSAAAPAIFPTRDDLVLAALDAHWAELRPFLDQAFDRALPPLDRLRRFFDGVYAFQDAQWSKLGCVVGCLLLRVGSATSRMGERPRRRVAERLEDLHRYVEGALKDAQEGGLIRSGDVRAMGWTLVHYVEGVLGMARIQNDLHTLHGMMEQSLEFLGARPSGLQT